MTNNEKQLTALITCGMTEEEAKEVLEADREIDKGAKLFDLPAELEAGAKKARAGMPCFQKMRRLPVS